MPAVARGHPGADREDGRRHREAGLRRVGQARSGVRAHAASLAGAAGGEQLSLVQALLFALLGGLILNLMPCVFPVLAMKAAAFARLAGHERSDDAARRPRLYRGRAGLLRRHGRGGRGDPRQRRRRQLGLPVPVAGLLAADRLSVLRGRPQPLRRVRDRRPPRRRRPGTGRARRHDRRLLHRRAGGDRGHALHRALHGGGPGFCPEPARARDRGRAAGDGPWPRAALSRAVDDAGPAAADAAARRRGWTGCASSSPSRCTPRPSG